MIPFSRLTSGTADSTRFASLSKKAQTLDFGIQDFMCGLLWIQ